MATRITCIVADDEAPIANRIARLAESENLEVLAICANGEEALNAIYEHDPQIAFLDISMPGISGLDVLDQLSSLPNPPACILVTAYDQHAVAAFALAAVDYVLKPVSKDRFSAAAKRACQTIEQRDAANQIARLRGTLTTTRPEKITLRDGVRIIQFSPDEISRIEAADDYVVVYVDKREHLLPVRLAALEKLLPAPRFIRCHRSHLINVDQVESCQRAGNGRLVLKIDETEIPVSRTRVSALRAALLQQDKPKMRVI